MSQHEQNVILVLDVLCNYKENLIVHLLTFSMYM